MKNLIRTMMLSVVFFVSFGVSSNDLEVNPFDQLVTETSDPVATDAYQKEDKVRKDVHPLQRYPVRKYTLMATLVSSEGKIAMVRGTSGREFFIRIDDLLGSGGGKISDINGRGIEVQEGDKIIFLAVRNRSVSNEENQ